MGDTRAGGGREGIVAPPAKALNNADGQLEDGIAKIAAKLGDERRSGVE
jgi:hypothetical protein